MPNSLAVGEPNGLAALCWDHHAAIAAAADGWPDPAIGTRWQLYQLIAWLHR